MPTPPDCRGCGLPCPEFGWNRARRLSGARAGADGTLSVLALLGPFDPLTIDEVAVCAACATLSVLGLHPRIALDPP